MNFKLFQNIYSWFLLILLFSIKSISAAQVIPPVNLTSQQVLIVDADTNTILLSHNANVRMLPSSMTKILTAYVLFQDIRSGRISLDSEFLVSKKAAKAEGTKMYLRAGSRVSVKELIQGIFVASANDACICVAENLEKSEDAFARRMNEVAKGMGALNSNFMNASGLPHPNHYSTCEDLHKIAHNLYKDFPEHVRFFSQLSFKYSKGSGMHYNLNRLVKTFPGADGLKTGHTQAGGYGVVASANINDQRIILVINGCKTMVQRNKYTHTLMSWAYSFFQRVNLFAKGDVVTSLDTWIASSPRLPLVLKENAALTLPKTLAEGLTAKVVTQSPAVPPIKQGDVLGKLVVENSANNMQWEYPLYAEKDLEKAGFFKRIPMSLYYLIFGSSAHE